VLHRLHFIACPFFPIGDDYPFGITLPIGRFLTTEKGDEAGE
jgi:hypothetical protein